MPYDLFISHASEDKPSAVRPLADALKARGLVLWLDELELEIGDSLRKRIDNALNTSRFGVVVLSHAFFAKPWPQIELDALLTREIRGEKVILPIWHGLSVSDVENYSPILASRLAYRTQDGIEAAADAIQRAVKKARPANDSDPDSAWQVILREQLFEDFNTASGPYQGYFSHPSRREDAARYQANGGEVISNQILKLPYYQTYWGYEAAAQFTPDLMESWKPITVRAIDRHFAGKRWLEVPSEYSFSSGPTVAMRIVQTIRHTARAAEVMMLLDEENPLVDQVVWDIVTEADTLQNSDGGWPEFRANVGPSSLWATIYVYRLLSKYGLTVARSEGSEAFEVKAAPVLLKMQMYLIDQWKSERWVPNDKITWDEGAAAVLSELARFLSDQSLIAEVAAALLCTLTPAGRLSGAIPTGGPSEISRAIRLAHALQSCPDSSVREDRRLARLIAWLSKSLDRARTSKLDTHDLAFASFIVLM